MRAQTGDSGCRGRPEEDGVSKSALITGITGQDARYLADLLLENDYEVHGLTRPTFNDYLVSSRFWFESFQNWQSEFLSLAAMVVLTIFLRQRGSPESKPVDAPTCIRVERSVDTREQP